MKKLPTLLITRELFIAVLTAFDNDNKQFEKITKAFGGFVDSDFVLNTETSILLEKIICDSFGNHSDPFKDIVKGHNGYSNLPQNFGDLYDYFMVDAFSDCEVSPEFIYELSIHHQHFKKYGSVTASFPRVLNFKEILIAQFIGFHHEIHDNEIVAIMDDSVKFEMFSVINNAID